MRLDRILEYIKYNENTSTITNNSCVVNESLTNIIEKCRPEYAILLNDHIPRDFICETENTLPDKYFCKKLFIINREFYNTEIKGLLILIDAKINVYEY